MSQSHGNTLWQEPAGAGAAPAVVADHFVDDGLGGYKVEALSIGTVTAARMLADAYGGYTVTAGPNNPSALAELNLIDIRGVIQTY